MTEAKDVRVELIISMVLRLGVLVAFTIVATGGTMYLFRHHAELTAFQQFHGETGDFRTIRAIWRSAITLRSDALIQLGLVVLITTPIVRVLMAAIGFAIEGDRLYVMVSSIVFVVLIYGLFHAI